MTTHALFSIVLVGRQDGQERQVAQTLARLFGREETWAPPIVAAAPVVLLEDLEADQALAVKDALAEAETAGGQLDIRYDTSELPKLSWPLPARIKNRALNDYNLQSAAPGQATTVVLPCPYTGQNMKVTIRVQVERQESAQNRPQTAGAHPAAHTPVPSVQVSVSAAAPHPTPAKAVIPVPVPAKPATGVALKAVTPVPVAAPAQPSPKSSATWPAVRPPQPEAPTAATVESGSNARLAAVAEQMQPQANQHLPFNLGAQPMDLNTFEARVREAEGKPAEALPIEEPEECKQSTQSLQALDNTTHCSIFTGKSANPKVHELVAEIKGVSLEEAAQLCQHVLVAVAKGVPITRAREIRQRFAAINVNVRITQMP